MTIIGFTGSRPHKLGGYKIPNLTFNYVCHKIEALLLELKPEKCISGLALGYDSWCAKICIKLRIPFIGAVSFEGQEGKWKRESKEEYRNFLDLAEEVVYVCDPGYATWKMQERNCWIVDNSDIIIACFNGGKGGTYNCVSYAKEKKKKIIIIPV